MNIAELIDRAKTGDETAWEELYRRYNRLVIWVANRYRNRHIEYEDLVGLAFEGFVKAVYEYKYDKQFVTYCVFRIKSFLRNWIRRYEAQKRYAKVISLETPVEDTEMLCVKDIIPYTQDFRVGAMIIERVVLNIIASYSLKKLRLINMYLSGVKRKTIAKEIGTSINYVDWEIRRFRYKVDKELRRFGYY